MSLVETIKQNLNHQARTFDIGTVESMEYKDYGDDVKVPTGMLNIRLASTGALVNCPYLTQSGGNSQFLGGLPENNAVCILANLGDRTTNTYVVLGFIPAPINLMVANRREMKMIRQGEIQMQASTNDGTNNWRAAVVKQDIYGRLLIQSGDDSFKITVGDMLSNEYTDNVLVVKDVITAKNIIYRMEFGANYSDTIDRDGNKIERWNSILQDCTGNHCATIQGDYLITTGKDLKLVSAGTGQYIQMTKAGIELKSLSCIVNATGDIELNASGQMILAAMLDWGVMVGGNVIMKACGDIIMAAKNMSIVTAPEGFVFLGSQAATQPVIRGAAWAAWIANPALHLDSLGMPITQIFTQDLLNPKILIP